MNEPARSFIVRDPGDFELVPEGTYIARCFSVVDLGTHQPKNPQYAPIRKVSLAFEIPEHVREDGACSFVTTTYTASLSERAYLRKALESWRGRKFTKEELEGFELHTILGVPAMVTVVHSEDGKYANISVITKPPKGTTAPPPIMKHVWFSMTGDTFDAEGFAALHEKLQNAIKESPEYKRLVGQQSPPSSQEMSSMGAPPTDDDFDDDIPF